MLEILWYLLEGCEVAGLWPYGSEDGMCAKDVLMRGSL